MTDLLLGQKHISKLTFPAKESPLGTGWHLAPVPVTTTQQVLFCLALSMALCFWPLSSSSIHCPRPFLLSFPVPFPASSHPSSQSLSLSLSLSLSISPSVLPPPQEWGKSSTLSKTLQTSCPPHSVHWIKGKEEGTLNQQWGWGLLYGAKEVRCRGGIWMECEGDCTSLLSDSWQKRARE